MMAISMAGPLFRIFGAFCPHENTVSTILYRKMRHMSIRLREFVEIFRFSGKKGVAGVLSALSKRTKKQPPLGRLFFVGF